LGFVEGLTLGLATGVSCLASCGPVYAAYLFSEKRTGRQSLGVLLTLNLGRFAAYVCFGALIGLLGGGIPNSVRVPLAYSGYILFSVFLMVSTLRVNRKCGGCGVSKWMKFTGSPFLLGILTGFSLCPAFLIAMTSALDAGGAFNGALLFAGFFLGTTVYMLPLFIAGLFTVRKWFTTVARVLAVFVAVYFLVVGVRGLAAHFFSPRDERMVQPSAEVGVFSAVDQDTLYLLTFPETAGDRGNDLAADLAGGNMPPLVLVTADSVLWRAALERIPELSGVIAPWWFDWRSEAVLAPWQSEAVSLAEARRFRLFAVEYEPYDTERAGIVYQYVSGFGYRCEPDSGFSFLIRGDVECVASDCSTCPAFGGN
jgi:sulfite exporter TauE/SafE